MPASLVTHTQRLAHQVVDSITRATTTWVDPHSEVTFLAPPALPVGTFVAVGAQARSVSAGVEAGARIQLVVHAVASHVLLDHTFNEPSSSAQISVAVSAISYAGLFCHV